VNPRVKKNIQKATFIPPFPDEALFVFTLKISEKIKIP